ncbi:CYTH domain-containing protein [Aurantimonas sp. A2-1-M11]|uniref:CYTH domain-containing protein n=1 Tax=Aurantimonas sp. A2-1-M11 TaxID=3113712 RepID=UPI002F92B2FC
MGREIERKFLVANDGWRAQAVRATRLEQFYLFSREGASARVRISGGTTARLTIKTGSDGLSRGEFEYDIPLADAQELRESRIGALVEKTRHVVPLAGGFEVEVDVFAGALAGLVMAEIELAGIDDAPVLPDFLGREVTGNPRYFNSQLALEGLPAAD